VADLALARTVDLRVTGDGRVEDIADELAVCLKRFLTASADERTMERARRALDQWERSGLSAS